MRRLFPALLACVLSLTACASAAPRPGAAPGAASVNAAMAAPGDAAIGSRLDSLLRASYPADAPGVAVLVRKGNQVLLRSGYGMASLELGVPIRPEHVFRIGSVTKQFTAAAILRLASEGRLSLDDEITRFFPEWPTRGARITVHELLTHTSGIRSYTSMPEWLGLWRRDMPLDTLIALFREQPMDFAPRERWAYNNSAYVLLGAILEKVSGRDYEQYIEQDLLAPLALRDTRYGHAEELVPGMVEGYQRRDGAWAPAPYLSMTQPHAAGALVSTVDDLARWFDALRGGRVLDSAWLGRAWTAVPLADELSTGYGYGWFIGEAFGRPTVEHGGGIHGFGAYQLYIPAEDLLVIVLGNSEAPVRAPGAAALDLARLVLGAPAEPAALALEPAALDAYVGEYPAQGETGVVVRAGDTLFTRLRQGQRTALVPVAPDEFVLQGTYDRVRFERDGEGVVSAVRIRPRIGPERRIVRTSRTAAEPEAVELPAEVLARYPGTYRLAPAFDLVVILEEGTLVVEPTGQDRVALEARSETTFALLGVPARIEFIPGTDGRATSLVLHQGGRAMPAPRVP